MIRFIQKNVEKLKKTETMKILIVEENKAIANLLAIALEQPGYNVIIAESHAKGIELIRNEKFHLLITNKGSSPMRPGLEVIEMIRAKHPNAWVILMTGGPEHGDEKLADFFLRKPFKLGAIYTLIKMVKGVPKKTAPTTPKTI